MTTHATWVALKRQRQASVWAQSAPGHQEIRRLASHPRCFRDGGGTAPSLLLPRSVLPLVCANLNTLCACRRAWGPFASSWPSTFRCKQSIKLSIRPRRVFTCRRVRSKCPWCFVDRTEPRQVPPTGSETWVDINGLKCSFEVFQSLLRRRCFYTRLAWCSPTTG